MNIIEIEGIGKQYKKKLSAVGINTVKQLLKKGATPSGRKEIEKVTGISSNLILKWYTLQT